MIRTSKGRFAIQFDNGYKISVVNGFGSYSENHYNRDCISGDNCVSKDCEIAILDDKNNFCTRKLLDSEDDVIGYVSTKKLLEIIEKVARS